MTLMRTSSLSFFLFVFLSTNAFAEIMGGAPEAHNWISAGPTMGMQIENNENSLLKSLTFYVGDRMNVSPYDSQYIRENDSITARGFFVERNGNTVTDLLWSSGYTSYFNTPDGEFQPVSFDMNYTPLEAGKNYMFILDVLAPEWQSIVFATGSQRYDAFGNELDSDFDDFLNGAFPNDPFTPETLVGSTWRSTWPGTDTKYAYPTFRAELQTSSTPIPGAVWLLGSGLVGLLGLRKKYLQ